MTLAASISPTHSLPVIPGYAIVENLYQGARTAVYRAIQKDTQRPVVIKISRREYPSFSELLQFRNQYGIVTALDMPGIVRPVSLEPLGNGYAFVMEDVGGIPLGQYAQHQPLALTEVLSIAVQIADILHDLGEHRVIHKDIKPANILIHPESKQVNLIDFSIASLLPKETQELQSPNISEGTLAYLAPEQTGRMNRGIDYRADFYALGVTLYELLTGSLPFHSDDPLDLMHCHIAKVPLPVNQVKIDIPVKVAEIITKLMAKNAEARYQSARGLKYDLQQCWRQLEAGEPLNFELGVRDLSDRFLIPEKLYGRATEVETLLRAFERVASGSSELMLVAGFSGIGKTMVVNEVHKPIVRQRGYFIKGKFDQFNRNIPLSAFVQALRDLIRQLLSESDAQLGQWRAGVLSAVGESGQVLIEVIPELEQIIEKQPAVADLSGGAAQKRFNLLFQKFVEVFTTADHPLVLFLDDLQWADSASLQLLQLLMENNSYLLILGAYRNNEVSLAHPFILTVEEIKQAQRVVHTITLGPLALSDTNHLIADTLSCDRILAQPLTELVERKTQGNPFFTTQFLKALYADGCISFNRDLRHWECDIAKVNALALTDDVVEFMSLQLQKLPTETQQALKLAACIGNQFNLATLAIISEQSPTQAAEALWRALEEGLILPIGQIYKFFQIPESQSSNTQTPTQATQNPTYRFLHDRAQQAAYFLIPEAERALVHYKIGKRLLEQSSPAAREERIFELVNQLNRGIERISDRPEQDSLAQLNLLACRKARAASAYQSAYEYADVGLQLLGTEAWQRQYDLMLALCEFAADAASLCGEFERMEQLFEAVVQSTQIPLEQVNVYQTKILALAAQHKPAEAVVAGERLLAQLGFHLPESPTDEDIKLAIQAVVLQVEERPVETLFHLPEMTDAQQIAIQRIAATIMPICYVTHPKLYPILVSIQVKRSIQFGNSPVSATSYACYGCLLISVLQSIELAQQFGQLAYRLALEPAAKSHRSAALVPIGLFLHHRTSHLRETLPILQAGYQVGVETGALFDAGSSALFFCGNAFWCGQPLAELEPQIKAYLQQMSNFNLDVWIESCSVYWQGTLRLCDPEGYKLLVSQLDQSDSHEPGRVAYRTYYLFQFTTNYLLGNFAQAVQQAAKVKADLQPGVSTISEAIFYFYDSLTALATVPEGHDENKAIQKQVQNNQIQLKIWAQHASMNYLHKWQLVEAEYCRAYGNKLEATDLYDQSISGAKANGYIQEEAIANELAAKFYMSWGKEKIAASYMQAAYYGYTHWGAKAKVQDLEQRYSVLLDPVLQQQHSSSLSVTETMFSFESLATFSISGTQHLSCGTTSISAALDLATVLKASQSLSSEIQLDRLLAALLHTVLENAGADKGALLLPKENEWFIEAIASIDQPTQVQPLALSESHDVSQPVINTVKRSLKPVVILNACVHPTLSANAYILKQQPKSILCAPIIHQSKLIAILYLENQVTAGAFTSDRIELLNFLCAQAAISLENARLYDQEQDKAQALQTSLNKLQQSELRFRRLFEKSANAILLLAPEGLIDCNQAAIDLFGYQHKDQLCHLHPSQISPKFQPDGEASFDKANTMVAKAIETGSHQFEWMHQRSNGEGFWADVMLTSILYNGAQVVHSIVRDISKRKADEATILEKSSALEKALQELQNTQLQTVQSEKMASLGNLVAGVAHEINNPIGFLKGSITNAEDYAKDILSYISLYQQHHPNPAAPVQAEAEEIDLEFLSEDLPKLLKSMQGAAERIESISTSLRTFSRADTEYKVSADLQEGIESTLLILKYRLKGNEHRPAIQIVRDYGEIPPIDCFPGQLNQVFMNILANAIDVFDETAQQSSFSALEDKPQRLTITTALTAQNALEVRIGDNGRGMTEEVKVKIFDHLFTTKGVGKGTGLGLAIAQQIVVEAHNGLLEVRSELGKGTEFCIRLPFAAEYLTDFKEGLPKSVEKGAA